MAAKAASARRAGQAWGRTTVAERVEALGLVWRELQKRRDDAVSVIVEETGKPSAEAAIQEFDVAGLLVNYYLANAERILGARAAWLPWILPNKRAAIRRIPRGIIGVIAPSYMPFLTPFADVFCAMLAGNAVLLKPSERATKTALWLESAISAPGVLPEGLLTVVAGRAASAEGVIDACDLVMFTGAIKEGRAVAARAAAGLKPAILEMGGKHPMIVCADASIERASAGAVWGALANSGQSHSGVERIFVENAIYPAFVEKVRQRMAALRPGVELGRLSTAAQFASIQTKLDDARQKGAQVIGGDVVDAAAFRMAPALVLNATPDMLVMSEETFGPVVAIMKVARAEEAVLLANTSAEGLSASVWCQDSERAERLVSALDVLAVGINEPATHYAFASVPFGGLKASGVWSRHGDEGLLCLTRPRSIIEHEWPADYIDPWWYPYEPRKTSWIQRILNFC